MGLSRSTEAVPEEEKYNLDTKDESIYFKAYPKTNFGLTLTLKDDRKLGYMIYGDTNCIATVILFPGTPGTRLFNFEPHDKINKAYGLRLIVVERPGVGLSSHQKDYTFKSFANDVYQLIGTLQLKTYHIVGYSAGGPFACAYCSIYANDDTYKLKSCILISSVAPANTPNAYKQMTFSGKIGWFLVLNANKTVIDYALKAQAKVEGNNPIKTLVEDLSRGEYDTEMMRNPLIIKGFIQSKYETKAVEQNGNIQSNDKTMNRLYELFGLPWNVKLQDILCPFYVYNGFEDKACVPNMAKYIFESVTGKKAPEISDMEINVSIPLQQSDETKQEEKHDLQTSKVAVAVVMKDEEEESEKANACRLQVDKGILEGFENEWNENEKLNVNNKQSKLIWGKNKAHLWFFEQDLWRNIVFRVIFLQQKGT